jgi:hypothetical protein
MRRRIVTALAISMLALAPALAAEEARDTSLLTEILGMLDGLSADSETEASPFEPPGFGGTPPGQGGTPPGQTTPPGQGGTPPGQSGELPQPPGQDGEVPPGHQE